MKLNIFKYGMKSKNFSPHSEKNSETRLKTKKNASMHRNAAYFTKNPSCSLWYFFAFPIILHNITSCPVFRFAALSEPEAPWGNYIIYFVYWIKNVRPEFILHCFKFLRLEELWTLNLSTDALYWIQAILPYDGKILKSKILLA